MKERERESRVRTTMKLGNRRGQLIFSEVNERMSGAFTNRPKLRDEHTRSWSSSRVRDVAPGSNDVRSLLSGAP